MRDRGAPAPAMVVALEDGRLGEAGLEDVLRTTGEAGGLAVNTNLHLNVQKFLQQELSRSQEVRRRLREKSDV